MSHWVCKECSKEIVGNDGCVLIYNGDSSLGVVGDYPQHPPKIRKGATTQYNESDLVTWPEAFKEWQESLKDRSRVRFLAIHDKCNPYDSDEHNPYDISIGDVPTIEKWMEWMDHIATKTWMTKEDLNCLYQYWFTHKAPD